MVGANSLTRATGVRADNLIRKTGIRTGTGSEESIAHGLGFTPLFVVVVMQEGGVTGSIAYGTHDGTNIKVTVPSGMDYLVIYG